MLREIHILNLAIVPESHIRFDSGLNVLTGETGAGKSILIDAIGLLAGKRAQSQDVRAGTDQASIEGLLEFDDMAPVWSWLKEKAIPVESLDILIRRTIGSDGRSRAFINDVACTVMMLSELSQFWLDMTGQHTQHRLLEARVHTDVFDDYAKTHSLLKTYQAYYGQIKTIDKSMKDHLEKKRRSEEQRDYYVFRLSELEEAHLVAGEEAELAARHERIAHQEKLIQATASIGSLLEDETGVLTSIGKIMNEVRSMSRYDAQVHSWIDNIESAQTLLKDLSHEISSYQQRLEVSGDDIDSMNARLSLLQKIARKYGSIDHAIEERNQIKELLSNLDEDSLLEKELKARRDNLLNLAMVQAQEISIQREKAVNNFSRDILKALGELGMPSATMNVLLKSFDPSNETLMTPDGALGYCGYESIEFQFSSNPGEVPKALESVASGGELSRILLALKELALQNQNASYVTYVFDEIDAGIGGETAERVGQKLCSLAKGRQVLCVTHLAQVSCYAHTHLQVTKGLVSGRTISNVKKLSEEERKKELARMIGGIEITQKTQDHANELFLKAVNLQTSSLTR